MMFLCALGFARALRRRYTFGLTSVRSLSRRFWDLGGPPTVENLMTPGPWRRQTSKRMVNAKARRRLRGIHWRIAGKETTIRLRRRGKTEPTPTAAKHFTQCERDGCS